MLTALSTALRNQIFTGHIRSFYICRYTLCPRVVRSFPPLKVLQLPYPVGGTNPLSWENVPEFSPVQGWPARCRHSLHIKTKV